MSLQQAVLKHYQHVYPQDTLKLISSRTNIQMTRVFRILNGSEMKLSEYEAFEKCLPTNKSTSEFMQTAKECMEKLNPERNKFLLGQMQHALKIRFLQEAIHPSLNLDLFA